MMVAVRGQQKQSHVSVEWDEQERGETKRGEMKGEREEVRRDERRGERRGEE